MIKQRSTSEGNDKLSSNLLQLYRLGSLKINISRISTSFIGDDPNIKVTLEKNRELEALKKRLSRQDPAPPSINSSFNGPSTRGLLSSPNTEMGTLQCCICGREDKGKNLHAFA